MEQLSTTEDERGVDVAQIQKLMRMTVAGRVAEMVAFSNTVLDIQAYVARVSTQPAD